MKLFTAEEEKHLHKLLSKQPDDAPIAYLEELHGLLFGLAITPETIPVEEWLPLVLSHENAFEEDQERDMVLKHLLNAYDRICKDCLNGKLVFPFDYNRMSKDEFSDVQDWAYGLFMALSLRPDIWAMGDEGIDQETYEKLPEETRAVLDAFTVVATIALPESMEETLQYIMEEEGIGQEELERRYFSELPLCVETLQTYSAGIRGDKNNPNAPGRARKSLDEDSQEKENANDDLCPCGSGRKYKKCCGSN